MTFEMSGLGGIESVRVGGLGVKTLRVSHIEKIIYMNTRITKYVGEMAVSQELKSLRNSQSSCGFCR